MDINLSISPSTTIVNKIAVVVYESATPNVVKSFQQFDPPHDSPRNIAFTDLNPVTHIVNTWETTGWPAAGTLRHSFIYDPSFAKAEIKATEFLYMTEGDREYVDANWSGWLIESIERVGSGTQYLNDDIIFHKDGDTNPDDRFSLFREDDFFQDQEKFVIRFYPRITKVTPVFNSAKIFTDSVIITGDSEFDGSFAGKLLLVQGDDEVVTLTFKAISTIGAFELFGIVSNGGNHKTVIIKSEGNADQFQMAGSTVDEIILGQSENLMMLSETTAGWVPLSYSPTILQAGEFIEAYTTEPEPNVLHCAGQELSRATYKRLWNAIQAMPMSVLVSDSTWSDTTGGANNKGKFSTGDGSTTFRLPQLYSSEFKDIANGTTRLPGTYKKWSPGDHQHETAAGLLDPTLFGKGAVKRIPAKYQKLHESPIETDLTSKPVNNAGTSLLTTSGEKGRPEGIAFYQLIRI